MFNMLPAIDYDYAIVHTPHFDRLIHKLNFSKNRIQNKII